MNKALFITFDNTLINTKSGRKIPLHSKDWVLNIEVLDAIKYFYKKDYKIIIVDNQEAVSEGYVHKDVFEGKVLDVIDVAERAMSISTNPICYTFWIGDTDEYYKLPNPGIAYESALEYELDLMNSIMVGSSDKDFIFYSHFGLSKYLNVEDLIKEEYREW